tara:strand:- start:247 stop:711 length:465 start_codon:yes stop_codon:yes gene_type:complete
LKTTISLSSITLVAEGERSQNLCKALSETFPQQSEKISKLFNSSVLGVELQISKKRKSRSRPQENYYRKWEREFAKHCGLTQDEMHTELLCRAFGSEEVETRLGLKVRPTKRSSKISLSEYSELIETLIIIAAEMGFAIPPPPTPEQYEDYANG